MTTHKDEYADELNYQQRNETALAYGAPENG